MGRHKGTRLYGYNNRQGDGKTEVQKDGRTYRLEADRQMHGQTNGEEHRR
jgi:hypothetical protein